MTPPWLTRLIPGPVRRAVRAEWGPLGGAIRAGLVRHRAASLVVTVTAVTLIVVCQYIQNQPWGHGPIARLGYVQADQPWWDSLLRTPLSLFVPAPDLPVWGGLLQIFVVFGICECALGWRRTLVVAYVATLAGTTYARLGMALGEGGTLGVLGLPPETAQVHDTGPSAAVVGLSVYVCWRYRAWLTGALVIASMVLEVHAKPNLAGREHLVAIAAILLVCAVATRVERRRRLLPHTARATTPPLSPRARLAYAVARLRVPRHRVGPPTPVRSARASRPRRSGARRPAAVPGAEGDHDSEKPPNQSWTLRRRPLHRAS
ncbi:hypothetical protein [Streptomyces sp. NPDC057702]|uniref:hypothetical protein n=1 Tax=unclassified Streptomyces TaxID=2593676 RepID=UPI0036862822